MTAAVGRWYCRIITSKPRPSRWRWLTVRLRLDEYIRLIRDFEQQGKLNRALEFLPADEQLAERRSSGRGLTRPELAVLIAYTKADLKEQLNQAELVSDPLCGSDDAACLSAGTERAISAGAGATPPCAMKSSPPQLANDMVNAMGITYVSRLRDATGAGIAAIARAYLAARDIFAMSILPPADQCPGLSGTGGGAGGYAG